MTMLHISQCGFQKYWEDQVSTLILLDHSKECKTCIEDAILQNLNDANGLPYFKTVVMKLVYLMTRNSEQL
ncbi:hypothetical protein BRL53_04790 [Corynebacterium ulcerans]|nr:hypothetical protein BRL53_04790 [Corynebacterium ulcerans]